MKRDRDERKDVFFFFSKNVSNQKNPPRELAQNVSKNRFRTNYSSFFFESSESYRFFNYLHDSNSNFRAAGIYSEEVFRCTVLITSCLSFFVFLFLSSFSVIFLCLLSPLSLLLCVSLFPSQSLSVPLCLSLSLSPCCVVCDVVLCVSLWSWCCCWSWLCVLVCGVCVAGTLKKRGEIRMWIPTRLRVYVQKRPCVCQHHAHIIACWGFIPNLIWSGLWLNS